MKLCLALMLGLAMGNAYADEDLSRILAGVCDYVKVDDRASLRRKLDEAEVDLRRSYDDLKCGKESLLRVAAAHGSLEAATFIISKAGKRVIKDADGDGMSPLQFAEKRAGDGKIKAVLDLMQSKL